MQSLLEKYNNGHCVWDCDLPYVIQVLTARMDTFIYDINTRRQRMYDQMLAVPAVDRTLQVCCDITINNL